MTGAKDYIASPAVVAYAGRQGIDLADVARRSGRTTLAREDIDNHMGNDHVKAAGGADDSRFWTVDHAAFGPVRQQPMSRIA